MIQTQTARRTALRDAIAVHGPEHFDMGAWAVVPDATIPGILMSLDLSQMLTTPFEVGCGTTCCLAGHAAALVDGARLELDGLRSTSASMRDFATQRYLADHFGLHPDSFFLSDWDGVVVFGSADERATLADLFHDAGGELDGELGIPLEGNPEAEWKAVLTYLDALIEAES